jgi:HEAT repeat protein
MKVANPDSFRDELLRIAGRVSSDHRGQVRRSAEVMLASGIRSLNDLLGLLQAPRDRETALFGCWVIGRLQGVPKSVAVRHVSRLLADSSPKVRYLAAISLGDIGSRTGTPILLNALSDGDLEVRMAVVNALGRIGDARAATVLRGVLNDMKEKPKLRGMAAEALGSLRDAANGDDLVGHLQDRSPHVRFFSAFALGELCDRRALRALRRAAREDRGRVANYGTVRQAALRAIEQIELTSAPRRSREPRARRP